ncbi:MAG TPA: hypothetical protein PL070_20240 [Flavobacteriales bacterium]|nr:hypothetical protein [Flavobacteriales bacterium]
MKIRELIKTCLFIPVVAAGQDTTATGNLLSNLVDKNQGIRVGCNIGTRFMPGSGGKVFVSYIDQSPSRDELNQVLDIPGLKTLAAYQIFVEGEYAGFFLNAGVDGFVGKFRAAAPFIGIGYTPFKLGGWDVRASARLTYGSGTYILGDVVNNSVYFQIKDVKIYDPYLRMNYKDRYVGVIPTLGIEKNLTEHLVMHASANLFVTVRHHTRVEFYGHDGSGGKVKDTGRGARSQDIAKVEVGLDEVDLDFIKDNEVIDKLPLYYTGLSLMAGVSYLF